MLQRGAYTYQGVRKRIKRDTGRLRLNWGELYQEFLLAVFCLLIGRAVIFGHLAPFGVALFAVLMSKRQNLFTVFLALTAGILSFETGLFAVKYLVAMGFVFLYGQLACRGEGKRGCFRKGIGVLTGLMLSNIILGYSKAGGMLTYDFILAALESAIGFAMVYVFRHALGLVLEQKKRRILSSEEMICISIFMALLLVGFWDYHFLGLSIRNVISVFIILIFAYMGGPGIGAAMGSMVGLVMSLASSPDPGLIATMGICGLMAGTFKELGRLGTGCAFILANALMTFYINKSTSVILPFLEILSGGVMLLFLPTRAIRYLKQYMDFSVRRLRDQNYYIRRMKELTSTRLKEFSEVFHQLARAFNRITEKKELVGKEEVSRMLDLVAAQVCGACALYGSCWRRDFYRTYSIMFELLTSVESKGDLCSEDAPPELTKKCLNLDDMLSAISQVYNAFQSNRKWHKKLDDCRQLVGQQLEGVSRVVGQLAREINIDIDFRKETEDAIQVELDKAGIRVKEVLVLDNAGGHTEINIRKKPCSKQRECKKHVEAIVSGVLGKTMTSKDPCRVYGGNKECILQLVEARKFQLMTGIARAALKSNGTCGDNYSFNALPDGKYMLALSDGMGTGARAAEESSSVITLLENFLEAGFDINITVKTINSILLLRSREEIFATVDLCVIDLITGSAHFIKIGAVSTFIKRADHVDMVKASTLPIGILENIQPEMVNLTLDDEDMIVMVTDGVLDSVGQGEDGDAWIANTIAGIRTGNPQEMADMLMEEVMKETGGEIKDDMTVMVSRIWKAVG